MIKKKLVLSVLLASMTFSCSENIVTNDSEKIQNCANCNLSTEKSQPRSIKAVAQFSKEIVTSYKKRKGLAIKSSPIDDLERISINVIDSSNKTYDKSIIPDELTKKIIFEKLAVGLCNVEVIAFDSKENTIAKYTKTTEIKEHIETPLNIDLILKSLDGSLGLFINIRGEGDEPDPNINEPKTDGSSDEEQDCPYSGC